MSEKKEDPKELVPYDTKTLSKLQNIGMSKVDPLDIRPPVIRLVQKSSDVSSFWDTQGNVPKVGQYFHTGRLAIMDTFECYILIAGKSNYIDKRKPEEGEKPQYKAIGAMGDDLSLFGLTFRSSALYGLSPLFSATIALKRPMFSIKLKFETKELEGEKGKWFVPVVRVQGGETDQEKLNTLFQLAKQFEAKVEEVIADKPDEEEVNPAGPIPFK